MRSLISLPASEHTTDKTPIIHAVCLVLGVFRTHSRKNTSLRQVSYMLPVCRQKSGAPGYIDSATERNLLEFMGGPHMKLGVPRLDTNIRSIMVQQKHSPRESCCNQSFIQSTPHFPISHVSHAPHALVFWIIAGFRLLPTSSWTVKFPAENHRERSTRSTHHGPNALLPVSVKSTTNNTKRTHKARSSPPPLHASTGQTSYRTCPGFSGL